MANPTLTANLNKAAYAPGELMTLIVNYGDADNATSTITVTGTDADGHQTVVTVERRTIDPVTIAVADGSGKVWQKISDTGLVATFTATA